MFLGQVGHHLIRFLSFLDFFLRPSYGFLDLFLFRDSAGLAKDADGQYFSIRMASLLELRNYRRHRCPKPAIKLYGIPHLFYILHRSFSLL